ncbi:MAG: helix-turn-helix domain-containing protein [Actinomycetota bacterium]
MTNVNGDSRLPDHLVALVDRANRRVRRDIASRIDWTGFDGLKPWHMPILSLTPDGGARPTELARWAQVTKQALTQLICELLASGYIELVADPRDRRARIVRRTARPDAALARANAAIARLEADWSARIGAEQYQAFREVLAVLADSDAPG